MGHSGSEGQGSLLNTDAASLDHDEVLSDSTVVRESTHRGDVLLGQISLGGGVVLGSSALSLSDVVDSLVDLGSVVVTHLTSSGDGPGDSGWMPSSDTTDLSVTSVGLLWQELWSPSLDDTLETVSLGDTDDIESTSDVEDIGNL